MTSRFNHRTARWLLAAGLAAGVASAYAATGIHVTKSQEALVTKGMSAAKVQSALGRPSRIARYGNEPGPTWAYDVVGALDVGGGEAVVFEVDFGAAEDGDDRQRRPAAQAHELTSANGVSLLHRSGAGQAADGSRRAATGGRNRWSG